MKKLLCSHFAIAALAWLLVCGMEPVQAAKKNRQNNQQAQIQAAQQAARQANQAIRRANAARAAQERQRAMAAAPPRRQGGQNDERKGKRGGQGSRGGAKRKGQGEKEPEENRPVARQTLLEAADAPPLVQSAQQVRDAAAKIDAIVLEKLTAAGQKPNPRVSDEQFLRRIYIDAAGRIPTADEAKAFFSARTPDKRARLIDALLMSEGYNSQGFNWLADMLRVKDKVGKNGPAYTYEEWLKARIAANSPWNETVYQMMTAEGSLSTEGATGYLLRDAGMPLDNLSNTLSTFLGANVACAQCHDHPMAPWTQRQFYEMAGFFGDVDTKIAKGNALVKKVLKQSKELDDKDKRLLGRLANANSAQVKIVPGKKLEFPKDYKYKDAKPGDIVHPALFTWEDSDKQNPAYAVDATSPQSRRKTFATWLTHSDNPRFAVAIANRLWRKNFGLAVQEPMTDLDDLSKASNPALLVRLGAEMKRLNFDLREFQRILYNTQTYQRQASPTPNTDKGPYLFPGPVLRRMTAEQAWDSVLTLAVGSDLDRYKLKRAEALQKFVIDQPLTPKALEAKALAMRGDFKEKNANGGYETEDGRAAPPRFAGMILARASELEQPAKESHFLRMFGQSDRAVADDSSREGGIPQVLMLMNGDVQNVLANGEALAMKSAARVPTAEGQIESLYLSFLGRKPTADEKTKVLRALSQGMTMAELTWVLFNTREFIFVQ